MPSTPSAKRFRKEAPDGGEVPLDLNSIGVRFHHVQMFADSIGPIEKYKTLEKYLNQLAQKGSYDAFSGGMTFLPPGALPERIEEGRQEWEKIVPKGYALPAASYASAGQDIVEQMIAGLGWRLTAEHKGTATRSVLMTSSDAQGTKMVITTLNPETEYSAIDAEPYFHFSKEHVDRFHRAHAGRPGIAVLGFEVNEGKIGIVAERYRQLHPKLLVHKEPHCYSDCRTITSGGRTERLVLGEMKILDVFAYYIDGSDGPADLGTVIRFVERSGTYASTPGFGNPAGVLPGLRDVHAEFNGTSVPCYSDHWVSNVRNRTGFLKTLEETVGFTPKVNFNAGVVAAGEAIIESTVAGNTSPMVSTDKNIVLKDQSQVYLPTNNALSEVGHVHGFVEEIGQGVQHLASRVSNLTSLIERVNNYRKITGRGFTFLRIPRSYYGFLSVRDLTKAGLSEKLAGALFEGLQKAGLMSSMGIINDLHIKDAQIDAVTLEGALGKELKEKQDTVRTIVKRARFSNLYGLLRDQIPEEKYLQIVENMVLVDIQGQDILYQIFTSNILQRKTGDEAPFLEFIERVCAECREGESCAPIKPGCGGFGIRNFLTLFLSIEVSKAMLKAEDARATGDKKKEEFAQKEVTTLTDQMNESNPVLTDITDAMTEEGEQLDLAAEKSGAAKQKHLKEAEKFRLAKEAGNEKLKEISDRYKNLMKELRSKQ